MNSKCTCKSVDIALTGHREDCPISNQGIRSGQQPITKVAQEQQDKMVYAIIQLMKQVKELEKRVNELEKKIKT